MVGFRIVFGYLFISFAYLSYFKTYRVRHNLQAMTLLHYVASVLVVILS